jgi:hypothetical protein
MNQESHMPIKSMTTTPAPGHLVQLCAVCGAEHRISLDRGGQKSRTGPFSLQPGATLLLCVDAGQPTTVTFAAGDFPDFARVTAAELAAKLHAAAPGVQAMDDRGGLLIESATVGDQSRLQIVGGTARTSLGFPTAGRADPCVARPVLGVSFGPEMQDPSVLALRRCNDCGANECLVRTFDATPLELDGTHFKEHRRAVNALTEHCKARGWSHADVAAVHAAETIRPIDTHEAFPDHAWDLSRFVRPTAPPAVARPREPRLTVDVDGRRCPR